MVWIGSVRSEKFKQDIIAQTFALIAPIRPVLHRVLSSNEMVPDEPNTRNRTKT